VASLATGLLTLLVLKTGADKQNRIARRAPQLKLKNPARRMIF
jgi:hypothetical protein